MTSEPMSPRQSLISPCVRVVEAAQTQERITDEGEAIAELQRLLSIAIERQCLSDVPLGAFLSGGVDSSTIVALMQAQASQPVRTFTIGFREDAFDEAAEARKVAAHLGTLHTELYVDPETARNVIPKLPVMYETVRRLLTDPDAPGIGSRAPARHGRAVGRRRR